MVAKVLRAEVTDIFLVLQKQVDERKKEVPKVSFYAYIA